MRAVRSKLSIPPRPAQRRRRAIAAALLAATLGCSRSATPPEYELVAGEVDGRNAETGELTVRLADPRPQADGQLLHCQITSDSEIHVNDRISEVRDIRPGQSVQLIGYRDRRTTPVTFIVTTAFVFQPQLPPARPVLSLEGSHARQGGDVEAPDSGPDRPRQADAKGAP
jgi:hypothetical protein